MIEWFRGEIVVVYYFATDERFEGEGGEHVEAETETSEVYHGIGKGEVV